MITVCVLLYGEFLSLADRCLRSITQHIPKSELDLRVGMNAVSPATRNWVRSWVSTENIYDSEDNRKKYPVMRDMFHDADNPITTDYIMWFDDDSYIDPAAGDGWLDSVYQAMDGADMIGSIYKFRAQGNQPQWIAAQPWYAGKEIKPKHSFEFITGGWWVIRTEVIKEHNWPVPELVHDGGDTMLGELHRQQDLKLKQFRKSVHINADADGKECTSKRRCDTKAIPIGITYDPSVTDKLAESALPAKINSKKKLSDLLWK